MEEWIDQLVIMLEDRKNDIKALQMQAYMKEQFVYYGITAPVRKDVFKLLWQEGKPTVKANFIEIIDVLWNKKQREYKYVAHDILKKQLKVLTSDDLPWIERMILNKSWWDTVDFLAPSCVGMIFKKHPDLIEPTVDRWLASENKWLIRSSILFQLKYKDSIDTELLFRLIKSQIGSKEFFINKASGWSLRQLARINPDLVKSFVNEHPALSNLTKREALKHFT